MVPTIITIITLLVANINNILHSHARKILWIHSHSTLASPTFLPLLCFLPQASTQPSMERTEKQKRNSTSQLVLVERLNEAVRYMRYLVKWNNLNYSCFFIDTCGEFYNKKKKKKLWNINVEKFQKIVIDLSTSLKNWKVQSELKTRAVCNKSWNVL